MYCVVEVVNCMYCVVEVVSCEFLFHIFNYTRKLGSIYDALKPEVFFLPLMNTDLFGLLVVSSKVYKH